MDTTALCVVYPCSPTTASSNIFGVEKHIIIKNQEDTSFIKEKSAIFKHVL